MSNKKSVLGKLTNKSLPEAFRCGECLHFKKHPHPAKKELCHDLAIQRVGLAPKCFTPDVSQIANDGEQIVQLATLFQTTTPSQKRVLLALLRGATNPKRLGWGTKVYFRAMGAEYISNYLSGFVIGYTSYGDIIVTGSSYQTAKGRGYMAYFADRSELMTPSEWKKKKRELMEKNKLYDPKCKIVSKRNFDLDEVPTLDSAPKEWMDKRDKEQRKRKRTDDLTLQII